MSVPGPLGTGAGSDVRLVPMALCAWAAAGLGVLLSPRGALAGALLAGACTAVAIAACRRVGAATGRRRRLARVGVQAGLAAAGVCAALLSAGGQQHARTDGGVLPLVRGSATVTVTAVVSAPPRRVKPSGFDTEPRWAVPLLADSMAGRGHESRVRTPLLVIGSQEWGTRLHGERVEVSGRLQEAEPGDSVVALLRPSGPGRTIAGPPRSHRLREHVRARLRAACDVLPPDPRGLLPGLVVGDTSQLPTDLEEAMGATGLTHLTAVSGANITIVAGAVLLVLTALGVRRRQRIALAGVAVLAFVAVAGPEPSVLRAAVMGCVGLTGLAFSRPSAGLPPLCLAVVGLSVADPWLVRSAGFALSVLATAGLVLGAAPLARLLERLMPRWLALAVAVPTAAQAAVGPVVILLQPAVPLYALPANMLVEPVVAVVTVLGAVAAVLGLASSLAAQGLVWLAGWPLRWIALVARTGAELPGATLPWPDGPGGAALLAVCTAAGLWALVAGLRRVAAQRHTDRRSATTVAPGAVRGSRLWVVGAVVAAVVLALVLAPGLGRWLDPWPGAGWRVVACDVGQGTAVVLTTGPGSAVLVDAGPEPAAVDRCLTRLGVRRLDLLVLTHFHADHVDGLPGALRGRSVAQALVTGLRAPAQQASATERLLTAVPVHVAVPGEQGVIGDVSYRVLGPPADAGTGQDAARSDDGQGGAANDASVAVWFDVAGLSVLSLGDAELTAQGQIRRELARQQLGAADVVVLAHHGSATQDRALYTRVRPRLALVSSGADNDYGHPSPSALRLLRQLHTRVARTDRCGDVAVLDSDPGAGVGLTTTCSDDGE